MHATLKESGLHSHSRAKCQVTKPMCAVLKEGRSCHTQKNANRMSSHSRKILTKRVNQILNEQTCQLLRKNHSSYNLDLETTMLGKLVSNYDFLKKKKGHKQLFFSVAFFISSSIFFRSDFQTFSKF